MKDASPSDYLKICNIYSCRTCMGRPFTAGQSQPADGQRVLTLGPGPWTLPTASPSPATLPIRPTTAPVPITGKFINAIAACSSCGKIIFFFTRRKRICLFWLIRLGQRNGRNRVRNGHGLYDPAKGGDHFGHSSGQAK